MRTILVGILIGLLLPLSGQAQHWLEVQTGPSFSSINLRPSVRQQVEQNWHTGLWWQYAVSEHTGLHAGLQQITRSWHILQLTDEEYHEESTEWAFAALSRVRIGKSKVGVAVEAGPYLSYVQDRTYVVLPAGPVELPTVSYSHQKYNDVLFGLRAGLGPVWNPGRFQLQLLVSYELGLTDVLKPDLTREDDFDVSQPQTTLISLGFGYRLKKE